ncbi:allergen Api m 6-like [Ctenocephalides felis]|uniref:allergen Api m 6-like n=1 Tax=Ctenocephalides felis TaxID=7515 RepID=UPI000E6E306C|nr:allergen Api m 6-like [Ctenocephalides felis]
MKKVFFLLFCTLMVPFVIGRPGSNKYKRQTDVSEQYDGILPVGPFMNPPPGVFGMLHHPVECVEPNEIYQHCEGHCDQMCDGSNKYGISCNSDSCISGCNCKPGYARNAENVCVQITKC